MKPITDLYQDLNDKKKRGQKVITLDYVIQRLQEAFSGVEK